MKHIICLGKQLIQYLLLFVITFSVLFGALLLVAAIPKEAIRSNMLASAQYLVDRPMFFCVAGDNFSTRIDRYADAILLSICYGYQPEKKMQSVLSSNYYETGSEKNNQDLLEQINMDREANQEYIRYWHGSISVLRPAFLFLNLKQIYWLNGACLLLLFAALLWRLIRENYIAIAVSLLLGAVLTLSCFVPYSLEYTWIYVIWLLACHIVLSLAKGEQYHLAGFLFLVVGMVTNYFDFLTTETMSLLLPLLLLLSILKKRQKDVKMAKGLTCKAIGCWTAGYAGMWISKWIVASLYLKKNIVDFIGSHVEERIGGDVGLSTGQYLLYALVRNVRRLAIFCFGAGGVVVTILLLFALSYILFVHQKNERMPGYGWLYFILAVVPYIRYLVLHNHAYLHYFFTYRAQFATVAALTLLVSDLVEWEDFRRDRHKR